jgi:hypothetical protein
MVVERAEPLKVTPIPPTCEEKLAEALARIAALEDADDDEQEEPVDAPIAEGVTATAAGPGEVEDVS